MDTAWRDWYLGALGVVRYLPKDAEVPAVEEVEPLPASTSRPLPPTVEVMDAAPVHQVPRPPLPEVAPAAKPKSAAHTAPLPTTVVDGDEERVAFRLAFWQPSSELVVFSAMPPGARPGRGQIDMLENLLKAIGQLPAALPAVDLLDWPLGPGRDPSLGSARQMMSSFLDAKQQYRPFKWVLLMGEMAARLAAPAAGSSIGDRPQLLCNAQGIVTHSLFEMDRDKALKRETWEALRFLAGATE